MKYVADMSRADHSKPRWGAKLEADLAEFTRLRRRFCDADFATFFAPVTRRRVGCPGDAGARQAQALRICFIV